MPQTLERFVFEDRSLSDWLLQLVNDDPARRKAAARVITDRFFIPMDLIRESERNVDALIEEFNTAVRAALKEPSFPSRDFVQQLLSLNLALHESWCAKNREDRAREAEADKAALAEMGENPSEAAKERYIRGVYDELLRDCDRISKEEPHEVFSTGAAITWVTSALGEELLPAAELLRKMLFSRHKASIASEAIGRMTRQGLLFYEDMLEGLKRDGSNYYCANALGILLRSAPEKIPEILRLACEPNGDSRVSAISAFGTCGKPATTAVPEVETRLREMLADNEDRVWFAAVAALGTSGQTVETVSRLLEQLDPARPGRVGEIIIALGNMAMDPERVVPGLTELMDTFEEFDPDCSYHGEHERVIQALRAFGPAAVSAVPALVRHIWTKPEKYWTKERKQAERPEPDEEVIKLLGELGPAASSALPALLEVQKEVKRRTAEESDSQAETSGSIPEPVMDSYVDIAIKQIRGADHEPTELENAPA